ncbi:uncharacterized protein LOC109504385 [Harpegnathos saltator]|uniref:uncharacterized protein LOC109504385 n=1 Tax=Harpegnathos saltator TaxID=610380 RepID=UPI0009488A10|nr:uncharacterized protein LOC109504385 [Harpegnathos saltator]
MWLHFRNAQTKYVATRFLLRCEACGECCVKFAHEDEETAVARVIMCGYCSWVSQLLAKIDADAAQQRERKKSVDPVVIVHEDVGKIPRYARKRHRATIAANDDEGRQRGVTAVLKDCSGEQTGMLDVDIARSR